VQRPNRSRHINHEDEKQGGQILDPESGKIYRVRIKLEDGGKKLDVRGFIGFFALWTESNMDPLRVTAPPLSVIALRHC
jgi:uncharacterized protein DUF2147